MKVIYLNLINKIINFFKNFSFFTTSYSINIFPEPLSKEEENKYIDLLAKNDKNARSKLIEHNLRLVAHIVKKYDSKVIDNDDLISIGTIGLIKGIDSYNKNKNVKLTTYVARCAENEILMYFRSNKKNLNNISLSDSVGYDKEGNEITLEDILADETPEYLDKIFLKSNIKSLNKYINKLSKREKEIIIYRFGLLNYDELTQNEIASKLNISRSYVSRIEKRALIKMYREFIKENKI
jgi:RNA polymerase sporulation-specific sigma factor